MVRDMESASGGAAEERPRERDSARREQPKSARAFIGRVFIGRSFVGAEAEAEGTK